MPSKSRRKVKVKARQLDDVDVQFLSIVDRGANRLPFRILKAEEPNMIDLSKLFMRKQDEIPAVVGVVVNKAANFEGYQKVLKDAGFDFPVVDAEDKHVTVVKSEDVELDDVSLVKISDDLAVMVTHIEKGLATYPDTESFMTNVTKAGFFPGFQTATGLLVETVYNIGYGEGGQEDTIGKLEKALTEYHGYVVDLIKKVPAEVFKIEQLQPVTVEKKADESVAAAVDSQSDDTGGVEKGDKVSTSEVTGDATSGDAPAGDAAQVKKGEDDGATKHTPATPGQDDPKSIEGLDDGEAAVKKGDGDNSDSVPGKSDPLADQISTMAGQLNEIGQALTQFSGVATSIASLTKVTDELKVKMDEVEKMAKSADEAVRGTVLTGRVTDDPQPNAASGDLKKGDEGLFDSALHFPGFETA